MLRRQRGTKTLSDSSPVMVPHQLQNLLAQGQRLGPMRPLPRVPMLQPHRSTFPIAALDTFRLPVTHPQQHCRIPQLQISTLDPAHHFHSVKFFLAHGFSPQSSPPYRGQLRGHFYRGQKGTLSKWYNTTKNVTLVIVPLGPFEPLPVSLAQFKRSPLDKLLNWVFTPRRPKSVSAPSA